jgi:hypothetical protein
VRRDVEATLEANARTWSPRTTSLVGVAVVATLAALAATFPLGLNGDVQHVIGGLATHRSDEPLGFVRTFTHRPLAYRGILDVALGIGGLVSIPAEAPARFEFAARAIGIFVAVLTGLIVWRGLRRRLDALDAAAAGLGVGLSLALAPNFDFLQAEWFAAAFAAAALGLAVGTGGAWVGAVLAGMLLALAVGVKLSTVVLAPAAVLVIAAMDRRRAALTVVAGLAAGAAWLALSFAARREWQWLLDTIALNFGSQVTTGLSTDRIGHVLEILGSKTAVAPILVTVPASIALVAARRPNASRMTAVLSGAFLLTLIPPLIQAEPFLYHLAPAHVMAAGLLGVAVARWWRVTGTIPWLPLAPVAAYVAVSVWALTAGPSWLTANRPAVMAGGAAAAILGLVAAGTLIARSEQRPARSAAGVRLMAGFIVIATLLHLPTVVPAAAWALDPLQTPYTNSGWAEEATARASTLRELSDELDAGDEVLYLAYGTAAYGLGSATPCRYPSPLFLQRYAFFEGVTQLSSYADNLQCLRRAELDALLLEPRWMRMSRLPEMARLLIRERFECSAGRRVGEYLLCPRR